MIGVWLMFDWILFDSDWRFIVWCNMIGGLVDDSWWPFICWLIDWSTFDLFDWLVDGLLSYNRLIDRLVIVSLMHCLLMGDWLDEWLIGWWFVWWVCDLVDWLAIDLLIDGWLMVGWLMIDLSIWWSIAWRFAMCWWSIDGCLVGFWSIDAWLIVRSIDWLTCVWLIGRLFDDCFIDGLLIVWRLTFDYCYDCLVCVVVFVCCLFFGCLCC